MNSRHTVATESGTRVLVVTAQGAAPPGAPVAQAALTGSGTTAVGEAFPVALQAKFVDDETMRPAVNVARSSAGTPLIDDRWCVDDYPARGMVRGMWRSTG